MPGSNFFLVMDQVELWCTGDSDLSVLVCIIGLQRLPRAREKLEASCQKLTLLKYCIIPFLCLRILSKPISSRLLVLNMSEEEAPSNQSISRCQCSGWRAFFLINAVWRGASSSQIFGEEAREEAKKQFVNFTIFEIFTNCFLARAYRQSGHIWLTIL